MDHLCYLCLVFVMLSYLFIGALWPPDGKGLTSWLLFVIFIVILLLSHLVLGILGEWLFIFRDLRITCNYSRGAGEQAHSFGDLGSPAKKQKKKKNNKKIKEKPPY